MLEPCRRPGDAGDEEAAEGVAVRARREKEKGHRQADGAKGGAEQVEGGREVQTEADRRCQHAHPSRGVGGPAEAERVKGGPRRALQRARDEVKADAEAPPPHHDELGVHRQAPVHQEHEYIKK
eukprot:scaffold26561_cov129-Isochrysis_galbana.AAC.4